MVLGRNRPASWLTKKGSERAVQRVSTSGHLDEWSLALRSQLTDATGVLRRDDIYRQLRQDILDCTLPPGVELYEGGLAERFNVSKSPVRDALSRLLAERLVNVVPRKGYRVAPISLSDARDLFQFRSVMESSCARMVSASTDREQLADLDRFREFGRLDDAAAFTAYNRSFHISVSRLCPNQRMRDIATGLIEQVDRLVLMGVRDVDERRRGNLVQEHDAIIDALQRYDGRLASRLLTQHVVAAEKRAMALLGAAAIVP